MTDTQTHLRIAYHLLRVTLIGKVALHPSTSLLKHHVLHIMYSCYELVVCVAYYVLHIIIAFHTWYFTDLQTAAVAYQPCCFRTQLLLCAVGAVA